MGKAIALQRFTGIKRHIRRWVCVSLLAGGILSAWISLATVEATEDATASSVMSAATSQAPDALEGDDANKADETEGSPAVMEEAESDIPLISIEQGLGVVKASPGEQLTLRVPLVVNPDLPADWSGALHNVVVQPLPGEAEAWPLASPEANAQRSLPDLSRGGRVEAIFAFTVKSAAQEGVYALPFGVSYNVIDENGELQEGYVVVECQLELEYSGTMVSVGSASSQGLLALDTEALEGEGGASFTAMAGEELTLSLPLVNNGDVLSEISVAPKVSSNLSEFPFAVDGDDLSRYLETLQPGESVELTFAFHVQEDAAAGTVPVQFSAVYREGNRLLESSFVVNVEIRREDQPDGTEEGSGAPGPSASGGGGRKEKPSLRIVNYTVEPAKIVAGDNFSLELTLQNESENEEILNIAISVSSIQAEQGGKIKAITPLENEEGMWTIEKMGATELRQHILRMHCSETASSDVHVLSILLHYEDGDGKQYETVQPVTVQIVQPVVVAMGAPRFETEPGEGDKAGDGDVRLVVPIKNEGGVAVHEVQIRLRSDDWKLEEEIGAFSLQAGEERELILTLQPLKEGSLQGELTLEYMNAAGETTMERLSLAHVVVKEEAEETPRETDEDGYWVLRDEEGNIVQRIDPATGAVVGEEGEGGFSTPLLLLLLLAVFAVGSLLGFWLYKRRGHRSA